MSELGRELAVLSEGGGSLKDALNAVKIAVLRAVISELENGSRSD